MKTIDASRIVWTNDSAQLFEQFINSPVGQLALARIQTCRPEALSGPTLEAAGLRGAELRGFDSAISALLSLRRPDPPDTNSVVSKNNYPSLDDDSAWEDGKTSNT